MTDQLNADLCEIEILTEKIEAEKPLVIEAFPGIGLIGNITGGHIVRELDMKYAGTVVSRFFPPIATLMEGIVRPPIKIYESKKARLVVIYSDIPINPIVSYDLAKVFTDFALDIGASEILSVAGILTQSGEERVFGAATTEAMLEKLSGVTEVFRMGTISGLSGSIMVECLVRDFPAISLIGETHAPGPDPLAASRVIGVINKIYDLDISVDLLLEEAAKIENELEQLTKEMQVTEPLPPREFPMYG
ncbi:proteasome assembly chaperone family protein [Methanosarcinales archaeon]|uniref:3-isopropylmalate dehydratase n=1 Tax=Candidatus Syntropharchaeum caldarium TaxID=1838285 RepID=A0A1F2P964_9EURY|nr:MAG: 3-isopropylmalate dehydratase [Candidatus Syntrophoarchaeum caldarius]RLG32882.1 MAG: proteasome assembly chaperone family protein [Methanosarcinales archaeon]